MEEKDFQNTLKRAIESSDVVSLSRACVNLSFANTLIFLSQKEKLKLFSKNTEEKFVKDLLYWLNEKDSKEKQSSHNKGDGEKTVDNALDSFKNSIFISLVGNLKIDDVKYLKVLDLYWPNRKNVNQLAKKCGSEGFVNITNKLLSEFKKPKELSLYKININYFLKNVLKEADIEFLDILWKTYSRDIKQVFQVLCSHEQFWMHESPKNRSGVNDYVTDIKYQRSYSTDPEIFNITNFTYEKLMWFEERGIGLKQCNYKNLDLYLPAMQSNEIADYINTNPKVITEVLKSYLIERDKDPSWIRPSRDNYFPEVMSFKDKLSKVIHESSLKIFYDSMEHKLEEKQSVKTMKI